MTVKELTDATNLAKTQTRDALQIVYDTLNQGQQKKLLKNEEVASLFELYGVEI